ncbi:filamentous hemagglutinin N-terminal domain-containing protein, partial [Hyella patelloides]|uniref:filamentous hemagglutinin N-terminal domain-containing protein n=1 Tax=Hyella patelloides TaxID=1982969 RepID=UPI00119FB20D
MKPFNLLYVLRFPLIVIVTLFCKLSPAFSQASNIVPDNTLGDESSQVIENVDGQPNEVITGGAQREQNLFHSFQEFNVSEGRGAFFANPEAVNNIFSRVTGSNPSNILGRLGVNGAANLYLINPNGIIFGANSSLDVQGSFSATTGNGIRFGEQGEFNTINPQAPELLTINPSAYLFNQIGARDINSIQSQGNLQVPEGENIVLLGGDITLKGNLVAPGGTVELGSVNDTGEIGISENSNLIFSDEVARGDISLSEGSAVFVSAIGEDGGGFINVYSQNLNLTEGSQMIAGIFQGFGDSDTVGGDIVIDVLGTASLDDSRITNTIDENAEGTTGKIEVFAESVVLQKGGTIVADTSAMGNAGDIFINATESVIVDGESSIDGEASSITSNVNSDAVGKAGDLEISTNSLRLTNGGVISTNTEGRGDGGNININATESVLVDGQR